MGKDVQESPAEIERLLSYCEINDSGFNDLRLGAGAPEVILSLPDEVTNIRFFMLEPLEGPWLRARWYRGEIDETGKLSTYPFAHPSQEAGAWSGFFLPLLQLTGSISQGMVAGGLLDAASNGRATWVRVRPEGLAVAGIPGPPTLASLLEDRPEVHWWPVYVRLYGDAVALRGLLEALAREHIPQLTEGEKSP